MDDESKRLIAKMDYLMRELREDISISESLSRYSYTPLVGTRFDELKETTLESYSDCTKRIILGDEKGVTDLENLWKSTIEHRANLLTTLQKGIQAKLSDDIKSQFWLKNQIEFLDKIEQIKKATLDTSLQDFESQSNQIKKNLGEMQTIRDRLEKERVRAQYSIPFQIFLWGIPIILGFYVSDKFTFKQNAVITGSFVFVVLISYYLVKYSAVDRMRILYDRLRGPRRRKQKRNSYLSSMNRIMFPTMIVYVLAVTIYYLVDRSVDSNYIRPFSLEITTPANSVPGSKVDLPFKLSYLGNQTIFDVVITTDSLGITSVNTPIKYPFISTKVENGMITLNIPPSLPKGNYPITVRSAFRTTPADGILTLFQNQSYTVIKKIVIKVTN